MTNRAAVLGSPIAHSLSPVLHNAAYRALGLDDWSYTRSEVTSDQLAGFIDSLHLDSDDGKGEVWRGLSLTMPLKKAIIPMGTPRDRWSEYLKVANTVVFRASDHQLDLYNTDVFGIEAGLNDAGSPDGTSLYLNHVNSQSQCVIIGSGSTAASALAALSELGATRVLIAARHPQKVSVLLSIASDLGVQAQAVGMQTSEEQEAIIAALSKAQYAVSTIPAHAADDLARAVGSLHSGERKPFSGLSILDVVYAPEHTALLTAADAQGARSIGGAHMLLWQAVAQVGLMLGMAQNQVPVDAMRTALNDALEKKE